jgi:predicted ribonuclease toxin of YeeF-YezG toxin-antitoxin module
MDSERSRYFAGAVSNTNAKWIAIVRYLPNSSSSETAVYRVYKDFVRATNMPTWLKTSQKALVKGSGAMTKNARIGIHWFGRSHTIHLPITSVHSYVT